ncbi:hypothetical protein B0H14DRAFT_2896369 [Mycena olivaceomarginata]|nr:hypothetical protein B0H14DRAFT_2896369 [Mycena olivaceomarginata]
MSDEDERTRTRAQALWLEKGTRRAAHARTGGAAWSARACPSILWRVRARARARFPMDEAKRCVYGRVMHMPVVSCEPGPVLLVLSPSMCVVRCWAVGDVDSVRELMNVDTRASGEGKVRRKNTVCGAAGRARCPCPCTRAARCRAGLGPPPLRI